MDFEILGEIPPVETIAAGVGIRVRRRLRQCHGAGNWCKLKGIAKVRLIDGTERLAEIHWYEAHGIGKKRIQVETSISGSNMNITNIEELQFAVCLSKDGRLSRSWFDKLTTNGINLPLAKMLKNIWSAT